MVTDREAGPMPGMVYQELPLQPGGRRIVVTSVMLGQRWAGARSVQVTNIDGTRRRWIHPRTLHFHPTLGNGRPRRQGYAYVRPAGAPRG